jgi:importin-5
MLASYDWRVRHAGLMAIAAIGEGTGKVCILSHHYVSCSYRGLTFQVMQNELGKIVEYVSIF